MKKAVILSIIISILLFNFATFTLAETVSFGYDFAEAFINANPSRVSGTNNEEAAAQYLADFFLDSGLTPYRSDSFLQEFKKDGYSSQNVSGVIKTNNPDAKQIIIGAHYDNVEKGEGAYDNGSGIGALAEIINNVKGQSYNVDLVFVAFGAEEVGMKGSMYFAENMTEEEIDNTSLMINIDSISCGDYLYLYTDEVENNAGKYFYNMADDLDINLKEIPEDLKTFPTGNVFTGYDYDNIMFWSDHAPFMNEGIDVAFFVGYNFENPLNVPEESAVKPEIMHKDDDTLEIINDLYGEEFIKERITNVASLCTGIIIDNTIVTVMERSKADKFNYKAFMNDKVNSAISFGVKTLIVIIMIIMYQYFKKISLKSPKEFIKEEEIDKKYIFDDLEI